MYQHVQYQRKCECCNIDFIAHDSRKRFCSQKCKDVAYKQSKGMDSRLEPYHRKCEICEAEFETFNFSKKTCSAECSKELKKYRGRKYHSKSVIKLECEICGMPFYAKQPRQKTCGNNRCKYYYRLIQHRIRNQKYKNQKPARIITYELRECKQCGELFSVDSLLKNAYCSGECRRKYYNARADRRIPKSQQIDKITLSKLYKRDNGICYLCGGKCDFNDWNISPNGNLYPGDNYPTKEHVIPVCYGGLNSWDNVRLAHWKCNIDKGINEVVVEPMSHEFAICEKSISNKKRTAQYTLDGELVKIWESTAQIKRDLGLNDKHIQNVCRGDKSNTGNAFGYHWEYVS